MNSGQVTTIICRRPQKCAYCDQSSATLCDFSRGDEKTCDTPMCKLHTWSPESGKDYCRFHRRQLQEPMREANRRAEVAARKRDSLIFIAQSKYSGFCREKDCGAKWDQGESMFWDSKTREVFCTECGELMQ